MLPECWHSTEDAYKARLSEIAERVRRDCSCLDGPLVRPLCVQIVRILREKTKGFAIVGETPGGTPSYGKQTAERFAMDDYATVGEFLDNALTGDTVATYGPGGGFAAETYGDRLTSWVPEVFVDFFRTEYPDLVSEDGYIEDVVIDDLSCLGIFDSIAIGAVRDLPLKEFYVRFLPAAIEAQAAEQR